MRRRFGKGQYPCHAVSWLGSSAQRKRLEHATDQSGMGREVDGMKVRLCKDADGGKCSLRDNLVRKR